MKIWVDLGTLSWSGVPPPNENLGRSWHFWLSWFGPPTHPRKMQIWIDLGTLAFCGNWYVETNHCIPQGYHLVPHVRQIKFFYH